MAGAMKTLSDSLVVIAALASMALSALGFSVAVWNGFWSGHGPAAILHLLLWLLPTASIFAFLACLVSRSFGLKCAWAIALGSLITSTWSVASGQSSAIVFLFPLIQFVASSSLQADALIQSKIAKR
jgi:hypothetical protein